VALCRELTKLHEEVWRGTLADAARHLVAEPPRGEYVVVLDGAPPPDGPTDDELRDRIRAALEKGGSTRDAVDEVVAATGAAHRRVYRLAHEE
jgi:16S rRNA (cytidine1402-2'-O)-methyltransferase